MTREEMLQDLAYARALAEEGRQTPLIGGSWLVLFGVITPLAYTAHYAALAGYMPLERIGFVWLAFGAAATIGAIFLRMRLKAIPGGASMSNRADRAVWQGVSTAILCVVAGAVLRGILTGDYSVTDAIMAAGFALYGVALYSTAQVSGQSWLQTFAWLSWLVSVALWFFFGEVWGYLVAAVGAALVLLVPGLIMVRREPDAVV